MSRRKKTPYKVYGGGGDLFVLGIILFTVTMSLITSYST